MRLQIPTHNLSHVLMQVDLQEEPSRVEDRVLHSRQVNLSPSQ